MGEEQKTDIINRIATAVCKGFSLGYFERDDLLQQCRLFGLEALPRFKRERTQKRTEEEALGSFLYTHIHNRLLNLIRDKVRRPSGPCKECEGGGSCEEAKRQERANCKKYEKWKKTQDAKSALVGPAPSGGCGSKEVKSAGEKLENDEILTLVSSFLEGDLLEAFVLFRAGHKIGWKRQRNLMKKLREIAVTEGLVDEEG